MHYLIDGHNLIAKLPDVDLADPDDEIELIIRLRNWAAESKRRQATVVFDRGAIGGVAHRLSSREITVIFAPPGKTADDLLIRRLKRLKNPKRYTLVSGDREIIDAARRARIKFMRSETFIERMGLAPEMPPEEEIEDVEPEPDPRQDPQLSEEEIQEWLDLFGPAPERKKKRPSPPLPGRRRKPSSPKAKPEKKKAPPRRPRTPEEFIANAQSEDPQVDEAEIAEWMDLFGPAPQRTPEEKKESKKKQRALTKKEKKKKKKPGRLPTLKEGERKLSEEEVDAWLELFAEDE
jgi:hypothetical protein